MPAKLLRIRLGRVFRLALNRDAQRAQKMQIVLRERTTHADLHPARLGAIVLAAVNLVQADGSFQHQQHVESVLANILHHPGDLLALDDRLVDGLAQLLNQFAQTRFHRYLHKRRTAETNRGRGTGFLYLTSVRVSRQQESGKTLEKTAW